LNKNQKLTNNQTTIDVKSVEIIKHSTWANKYSEQYDIGITIGEVDVIVDLEYKKRK
jgi:hypothetical protein